MPLRQRVLLVGLSSLVTVPVTIVFFDRAISNWSHAELRGNLLFEALPHIAECVLPLAALMLLWLAIAGLWDLPPVFAPRPNRAWALSAFLAYGFREQLKWVFGRTWPETWINNNPSWIGNGVFGFSPFHGGAGWSSFPSGHTIMIMAPMTVLWLTVPQLRPVWAGLVILVVIGLLGADFHWLGDIIAGAYVGLGAGLGALAFGDPRKKA